VTRSTIIIILLLSAFQVLGCQQSVQISNGGNEPIAAPLGTISVYQLAGRLDLSVVESFSYSAKLGDSRNSVMLFADPGGRIFVNGKELSYQGRITPVSGMLFVPAEVADAIRSKLRSAPSAPPPVEQPRPRPRRRTVVLDPGHGGKDPGAIKYGIREKDVNLAVASLAARNLRARGVQVILTRSDDTFIELNERAAIANRAGADLFVSIHADSCPSPSVRGFTAYVARSPSQASIRAARSMLKGLREATGASNHGLRHADYRVLVRTSCPAVLVELGYLSNNFEAVKLADSSYQKLLAEGIVSGVTRYLHEAR